MMWKFKYNYKWIILLVKWVSDYDFTFKNMGLYRFDRIVLGVWLCYCEKVLG